MAVPPYPSLPAPSTYQDLALLRARDLRNDVANAVSFLANRPLFLGQTSSGPSIPNAAWTPVPMAQATADTWGGFDPLGSHPERYYCQVPGWYLVTGYAPFPYTGTARYLFGCGMQFSQSGAVTLLDGEQVNWNLGYTPGPFTGDLIKLTKTGSPGSSSADWVALAAYQATGAALGMVTTAARSPWLSARWVASSSGTTGLSLPSNPAWPTPPSYVDAAFLNANVRDVIRFLTYPPIFRGWLSSSSHSLSSSTFPAGNDIPLDTVTVDNYSGWSAANSYWTVPVSGLYTLYGQVAISSTSTAPVEAVGWSVDSGTTQWCKVAYQQASGTGAMTLAATTRMYLGVGERIRFRAQQSSGSSLPLLGDSGQDTRCVIVWEAYS